MHLSFESEELRELFENYEATISYFGKENADIFFKRVSDMESAENIGDLPIGKIVITDKSENYYILEYEISNQMKMILKSNFVVGRKKIPENHLMINSVKILSISK